MIFCCNNTFLDKSHVTQILTLHHQLHSRFRRVMVDIFGLREQQYEGEGEGFGDEFIYHARCAS